MCKGSDRDEIDATLRIVAKIINGDATTGLCLETSSDEFHGFFRVGWREVIKHDPIHTTDGEDTIEFIEVTNFYLDLQVLALRFEILVTTVDGVFDASREIDVIVLEENHVKESDAMVDAATDLDGSLLQHTHPRCGLARIEDAGMSAFETLNVLMRHRGDARHTLHDIQHEALGLEEALHLARDNHGDVSRFDVGTIIDKDLYLHGRVKTMEYLLGDFHTSQDAFLLDEEFALAHSISGDATEGGMVTITDVFGKGQVDKPIYKGRLSPRPPC